MTDPASKAFAMGATASELVGRDSELDRLGELIERAVSTSTPQLLTVVGNQGTGKSRLVAELIKLHVRPPVRAYHGAAGSGRAALPRHQLALARPLRHRRGRRLRGRRSHQLRERGQGGLCRRAGVRGLALSRHVFGPALSDSPFLRVLRENRTQHDELARTVLARFIEADAKRSR